MIRLVTLDFWQTLFADTQDGLRRAHALRLEGVRAVLAESGRLYDPAALAAADGRAGEAFGAVWRDERDMAPDEQLRMFLAALDPRSPARARIRHAARVAGAYQEPALTHRPEITPGRGGSRARAPGARPCPRRDLEHGADPGAGAPATPGGRGPPTAFRRAGLLRRARVRKPATAMFRWVLDAAAMEPARRCTSVTTRWPTWPGRGVSGCGRFTSSRTDRSRESPPTRCSAASRTCRLSLPTSGSGLDCDFRAPPPAPREPCRNVNVEAS